MTVTTWTARVSAGRLVLDEPTDLPEGTELELAAVGDEDSLTEAERAVLHAAIDQSLASAKVGRLRPASEILEQLQARHR